MRTKVLLVEESRGQAEMLALALVDSGFDLVMRITTVDDIVAGVMSIIPDVLIVALQAPNNALLDQLESLGREYPLPIVLYANESEKELIEATIKAGVSAFIVDDTNTQRVRVIVEVAIARFKEHHALRIELAETKSILQDRKVIERAKGIIMNKRNMTEEDAYTALRKLAMNQNKRISIVAKELVNLADLLF